jgi:hypothetical protein
MSQSGFPGGVFAKENPGGTIVFEDFRVGKRVIAPSYDYRSRYETLHRPDGALRKSQLKSRTCSAGTSGESGPQGFLRLAISSGLMFRAGDREVPRSTIALWGIENARFLAPPEVGDTIHVLTKVAQLTAIDTRRGLITYEHRVVNQ